MKWNAIKLFLIRHGVKTAVILTAVGAGVSAGSLYRSHGSYQPGAVSQLGFRENDIIFPGTKTHSADDSSETDGDSDLWQKEEEVHENEAPQDTGNPSQLFEDSRLVNDLTEPDTLFTENPLPDLTAPTEVPPDDSPRTPVNLIVPGNSTTPDPSSVLPSLPGGTTPGGVPSNTTFNNGSEPGANQTPTPTPIPTPTPAVTPTTPEDPTPSQPQTPDPTPIEDSEQKPAEHPIKGTSLWNNSDSHDTGQSAMKDFPTEGIPTDQADTMQNYRFLVDVPSSVDNSNYQQFYRGEALSYWKVLYAFNVTIFSGDDIYAVTDETENLQIDFPETAEPDEDGKVAFTFRFRLNEDSDWKEYRIQAPVYDQKLIFADADGQPMWSSYLNQGDIVSLYSQDTNYLDHELIATTEDEEDGTVSMSRMFRGWSEEPDGELIPDAVYTCREEGVKKLYSAGSYDVPDTMKVLADTTLIDGPNDSYELILVQVLDAVEPDEDGRVVIPEGIHKVTATIDAEELQLPSTLSDISEADIRVQQSIELDDRNPYFASEESALLFDKDETDLLLAAEEPSMLTIPETVTAISAVFQGDLPQILQFLSEEPFDYDFNTHIGNEIVRVSDRAYADYLVNWTPDEAHREQLISSDEMLNERMQLDRNGAVLEHLPDGQIRLCRIPVGAQGSYLVPDQVTLIGANVLKYAPLVESVILPESVKRLEMEAFSDHALSELRLLHRDTLPQIDGSAFPEEEIPTISISESLYEAAASELPEEIGEHLFVSRSELVVSSDGSIYELQWHDENSAELHLTRAARNASEWFFEEQVFPDTVPEGTPLTSVGDRAFADCDQLLIVSLSNAVTHIGAEAFADCQRLEGVLCETDLETADQVTLGSGVFSGCDQLRFAAFDTWAEFENPEDQVLPIQNDSQIESGFYALFLPLDLAEQIEVDDVGYELAHAWSNHYTLVPQEDGYLLYAEESGVLAAATSTISGEITLLEGTDQIAPLAFCDCDQPYSLEADSASNLVYISYMAFLGSAGFLGNTGTDGVLELGENLDHVEQLAFAGCISLTKVEIRMCDWDTWSEDMEGRVVLPYGIFMSCQNLADVSFADDTSIGVIEECAFADIPAVTMTIPESVSEIRIYTFGEALETLNFVSEVPPLLSTNAPTEPFYWKYIVDPYGTFYGSNDIQLLYQGETVTDPSLIQPYLDQWKYNLYGYYADGIVYDTELDCMKATNDSDVPLTDEDYRFILLAYENEVRDMFLLPNLTEDELLDPDEPDDVNEIDINDIDSDDVDADDVDSDDIDPWSDDDEDLEDDAYDDLEYDVED